MPLSLQTFLDFDLQPIHLWFVQTEGVLQGIVSSTIHCNTNYKLLQYTPGSCKPEKNAFQGSRACIQRCQDNPAYQLMIFRIEGYSFNIEGQEMLSSSCNQALSSCIQGSQSMVLNLHFQGLQSISQGQEHYQLPRQSSALAATAVLLAAQICDTWCCDQVQQHMIRCCEPSSTGIGI